MSKTPEAVRGREFVKYLKRLEGVWGWKIHGGAMQAPGIPDYIFCISSDYTDTSFVGIEMKYTDRGNTIPEKGICLRGMLSKIQLANLSHITRCEGLGLQLTFVKYNTDIYGVLNLPYNRGKGRILKKSHLNFKAKVITSPTGLIIFKRNRTAPRYDIKAIFKKLNRSQMVGEWWYRNHGSCRSA